MEKLLILGAKGNLGCQLSKAFASDFEVIAWDKEDIDICDQELIVKKVVDIQPQIIINAAAYNAVDNCEEDENEFVIAKKLNGLAPGYLADAAIAAKALLIHYSTDYIFSGEQAEGYRESDEAKPISKYGESKLLGEQEIIKRSSQGLKWIIIRTSKLFGPQGESEVAKPSFFDIMLKLSQEKDQLDVVDEEKSCFTYTPDLAQATKDIIESGKKNQIFHITNANSATWHEAARELFQLASVDVRVNPVSGDKFPRPARRPKYSILLNTKIDKLRPYTEALGEYLSLK